MFFVELHFYLPVLQNIDIGAKLVIKLALSRSILNLKFQRSTIIASFYLPR